MATGQTDMFHGKLAKSSQMKYANCAGLSQRSGKRHEQHMIPFLPGNWDAHILAASNRPRDTKNVYLQPVDPPHKTAKTQCCNTNTKRLESLTGYQTRMGNWFRLHVVKTKRHDKLPKKSGQVVPQPTSSSSWWSIDLVAKSYQHFWTNQMIEIFWSPNTSKWNWESCLMHFSLFKTVLQLNDLFLRPCS